MRSIWAESVKLPAFGQLQENIRTDVLVVGGGITGILCAYMLQQIGADYVLAEGNEICSGITKNTTAKITSQHGLIYDKLIRQFGIEKARMYLHANEAALQEFRTLCQSIDCGFETRDSYVYSTDSVSKLRQELTALNKIGFHAEYADNLPLPFPAAGAVKFKNQAQFNPLQFIAGIVNGLRIYEHTPVRKLSKEETSPSRHKLHTLWGDGPITAFTDHGKITASKVIVTTHFPFINTHGSYFLKMYQHRSYVLALEHAAAVDGMFADQNEQGMSFRNYGNLLLIGGGAHRTGKKGGGFAELEAFAAKHYPEANITCRWATQDCMPLDDIPYIGQYSKHTPSLYAATGFHKWGMTSSMAAAMILRDMVLGKAHPYAPVFSPSRTMLRPQLFANALESTINLLTPTAPRCPHLGCALKWNAAEHSWDCPCHGSRFTEEGKLIDNPAMKNLK